jgi:pimeloyl-ACP methyl ester carboxylesterase
MLLLGRKYFRARWDQVRGLRVFSRWPKDNAPALTTPIVLVHGLGVSSRYMMPLACELARRNCLVAAPDLPGYGRSQKPRQPLNIHELGQALIDWLDAVDFGPSLFIANSMGCQILVELAHIQPARMLGCAFLGPTMDQFAPTSFSQVLRLFLDVFREPPSLIPIQAFEYLSNGPIRTIKTFRYAVRHNMLERVGGVTAPCLLLRGERDPIAPQRWVEALGKRMPDSEVREVPGAGHALNYNSAPVIAPQILEFWKTRGIQL